ncbi:hypothetical protein Vafri_16431 [Volvox africanus]|uniref:Uncharacterized protein n=1 Tax=Volvox africanus TaxID=51714 RepID=A0A8J4BIU7_9CHLO|nr:hypothetical protein Vafri_16431 [Volvox africanus]
MSSSTQTPVGAEQPSTSAPPLPPAGGRRRVEYYKEENFQNIDLTRTVHLGWGALGGSSLILFCMGMSAATQVRGHVGRLDGRAGAAQHCVVHVMGVCPTASNKARGAPPGWESAYTCDVSHFTVRPLTNTLSA